MAGLECLDGHIQREDGFPLARPRREEDQVARFKLGEQFPRELSCAEFQDVNGPGALHGKPPVDEPPPQPPRM